MALNKVHFKQIGSENADIRAYSLTPGATFLYAANGNKIELYDLKTGQILDTIHYSDTTRIRSIVLSSDSITLVSGFSDGIVIIHDLINNKSVEKKMSDFMITGLDIRNDRIILGTYNGEVIFADKEGNILDRKRTHDDVITKIEISKDGRLMASAGMDGRLNIYNLKQNNNFYCLIKKDKPCRDVEISSACSEILVCFDNGRVENWRINYDNSIQLMEKWSVKGWIMDVCLYNDSKTWVACTVNGMIQINTMIGQKYKINLKYPLLQAEFIPIAGLRLCVVAASLKNGLKVVNAIDMKMIY